MIDLLRVTPFHARFAELNRLNRWENRGGYTLATALGEPRGEALAARFGAAMGDLSWQWRAMISGERAGAFVSRLLTADAQKLEPGRAMRALWLADGGGVRGIATLARLGKNAFLLQSETEDMVWVTGSAGLFGALVKPLDEGVLTLTGPCAAKVLAAAGLDPDLPELALKRLFWRGLDVMLSRFGQGYEVMCTAEDALITWDRLMAAGKPYALQAVGVAATDLLDLESGVLREGRDFDGALSGMAGEPLPQTLGLAPLVDSGHDFNGRAGFLAGGPGKTLMGVVFGAEAPMAYTALTQKDRLVGKTFDSALSPALGRAVALAVLEHEAAVPGTALMAGTAPCHVAALPFLPIPAPIVDGKPAP